MLIQSLIHIIHFPTLTDSLAIVASTSWPLILLPLGPWFYFPILVIYIYIIHLYFKIDKYMFLLPYLTYIFTLYIYILELLIHLFLLSYLTYIFTYSFTSMQHFFMNTIISVFQFKHLITKTPGHEIFKMWNTIFVSSKLRKTFKSSLNSRVYWDTLYNKYCNSVHGLALWNYQTGLMDK